MECLTDQSNRGESQEAEADLRTVVGYRGWWYSMWTFADWVRSIQVAVVTVEVTPADGP